MSLRFLCWFLCLSSSSRANVWVHYGLWFSGFLMILIHIGYNSHMLDFCVPASATAAKPQLCWIFDMKESFGRKALLRVERWQQSKCCCVQSWSRFSGGDRKKWWDLCLRYLTIRDFTSLSLLFLSLLLSVSLSIHLSVYPSCICLLYHINYSPRADEYFKGCRTLFLRTSSPHPCLYFISLLLPLSLLLFLCLSHNATVSPFSLSVHTVGLHTLCVCG